MTFFIKKDLDFWGHTNFKIVVDENLKYLAGVLNSELKK